MRLSVTDGPLAAFELPMTQEQLADTAALTSVHVNRMLMQLQHAHLITRDKRAITILDWDGLQRHADFNPRYLHLRDRAA